ncbi:MAG: cytidylate kinase-like family protein [Anaerolineaceae bacterium]|nr:cytidylate kinase-like family protein [Anaerolineaceae bacterium]
MTVITISRQFASAGDEIAIALCRELNYRLFDKRFLTTAAKEAGLTEADVLDFSEDNYHVRGFMDRLFGRLPVFSYGGLWPDNLFAQYLLEESKFKEEDRFRLVQKAIHYACQVGNMVILGRGGQAILSGLPGVINIRIEAPLEDRIQRLQQQLQQSREVSPIPDDLRRKALETINRRDAASRDYLKFFFQIDWDDPLLYHLVLNTGRLTIAQAVATIIHLAQTLQPESASLTGY